MLHNSYSENMTCYSLYMLQNNNKTLGYGIKRATTTPTPARYCGWRRDAFSAALKICLIKCDLHLNYHQWHIENDIF
jgi:hypothetical protein